MNLQTNEKTVILQHKKHHSSQVLQTPALLKTSTLLKTWVRFWTNEQSDFRTNEKKSIKGIEDTIVITTLGELYM